MAETMWAKIRPTWSRIRGNCNAEFLFAADAHVRCTGIEGHDGLHRCHYDTGPQKAMLMWGGYKHDVDLDRLVGSDPLRLVRVVAGFTADV